MMYAFSLLSALVLLDILPRENLFLAQAANVAMEGDFINLYVFRYGRNWTNYRVVGDELGNYTGRPSDCPVVGCDGGVNSEDCVPYTRFWPENVCMRNDPRSSSSLTILFRRTTDPDKISEGFTMEKCSYSDLECNEANRLFDDCQGIKVDTCSGGDSAQEIKKLQDWCMVGTEPRGDFIVPLARWRNTFSFESDTALDCATAPYKEIFAPLDPQLCIEGSVRKGNQVTLGSFRLMCNDDGSVTSERWDDTACRGLKDNLYEPVATIPGSCPANGVLEAGLPFSYYPACATPSIFCKDIADVLPRVTRQAALRPTLDPTTLPPTNPETLPPVVVPPSIETALPVEAMPVTQGPFVSQTPPPVEEALSGGIPVPVTFKPGTTPPKEIKSVQNLVLGPTSGLPEGAQPPTPAALEYVVRNMRRPSENSLPAFSF